MTKIEQFKVAKVDGPETKKWTARRAHTGWYEEKKLDALKI